MGQVEFEVCWSGRLLVSESSSEMWQEVIEQGSAKASGRHFRWKKL